MDAQLELLAAKAPAVTPEEVDQVVAVLRGVGWVKSSIVLARVRKLNTENNKRWLREVAKASKGQILSYPGSPGYRLTVEATVEDVAGAGTILHQANEMRQHYLDIERVYHKKG